MNVGDSVSTLRLSFADYLSKRKHVIHHGPGLVEMFPYYGNPTGHCFAVLAQAAHPEGEDDVSFLELVHVTRDP